MKEADNNLLEMHETKQEGATNYNYNLQQPNEFIM